MIAGYNNDQLPPAMFIFSKPFLWEGPFMYK